MCGFGYFCGMSLFLASLNSGSNGNCYYVGNETDAVLVDAGISCREIEKRLAILGLDHGRIRAIFVTHEHTDHIRGIEVFARKHGITVCISPGTFLNSGMRIEKRLVRLFADESVIALGSLEIHPFRKTHDASDPFSFTVSGNGVRIAVITDIGHCCDNVAYHFAHSDAAILESNYDPYLLHNGRYPFHLRRRISGGRGHISNDQALELFLAHRSERLSHLILGHLSQDNNSPDIVYGMFSEKAGKTLIHVASRHEPSPVFHIIGQSDVPYQRSARYVKATQLSLF
jgi:phosphoribosyl 1,2-cyclic phosphodiesterase